MDGDYRVPVGLAHLVEHAVAQDAGGIDHRVQAAKRVQRLFHHAFDGGVVGDAFGVGDSLAARVADFLGYGLGRAGRAFITAGERTAQVVDDDLGAFARRDQGALAANAVAAAGDQHHLTVQYAHDLSPFE